MNTLVKKYRFSLIIGIIALALLSVSQFSKLTINPSFDDYIPTNVGNRAYLNQLDSIFGGSEKIMLILTKDSNIINQQTYDRMVRLSEELQKLDGVENCLSLIDVIDIKLEDGITELAPIIDKIPTEPKALKELKQKIRSNKIGQRFVASDFSATAIIITKSNESEDGVLIPAIQEVIEQTPGQEKIYIGGLSYIRHAIKSYIKKDLFTLLPAALILMVFMLYFSFREWKGVLLPFAIVILSILFSFGFMALMGWEISLISVLLPIMLIAIANDYSIHLINAYQEKLAVSPQLSMKAIAAEIYRELRKPIVITALTTIGGMLGLLSHQMKPAAQLGVLASVGIGLALLMSLFLVPVLLTFYQKPNTIPAENKKPLLIDKILNRFAFWVTSYPKSVIASFLGIALISTAGLFLLKVDTNVESYFIGKSDIRQGIELVNEKFGGSQYISLLFEGDVLSPETLTRLENYTKQIEQLPEAGHVISPSTFFKELSKGMYTPEEVGYLALPASKAEAEQSLEIFTMGGYEDQIAQFIDYNYEHTRILVSLNDGSNQAGKLLLKSLHQITQNDPQLVCIAGPGLSKIQIADMVIEGQVASLLLALAIIFVLLSIIFKSFAAGAKGSLPLVVSTLYLFGMMGFVNIHLDIVTALLSSIMIGVGIDYTIHFLWRYKTEYAVSHNSKIAITQTLKTTGKGIVFNAFSVIVGFSALIFSSFAPLRFFGLLVVISIFSCLISALLLIPALITITKPKFLESNVN
ncbi:efflux RND transporter permease subunit [Sunxiuqinia rutila]|uniref:efflux RND transporter permease subunit n=1 Tax=Sunxiuqinia rutila TaxID=1397841 RepID=UPI003D36C7C2